MEHDTTVALREVEPDDLPLFFEHQRDPRANEMAAFPPRERVAFMAHWLKIMDDETCMTKTVLADGRVAGNVVSFDRLGEREVGYWIGRDHWGKGIATAALAAYLHLEPARPLTARVATTNVGSIRVLQKCGFIMVDTEDEDPDPLGDGVEETVLRLYARP